MTEQLLTLPLTKIQANPYQPRKQFDQKELEELAQSILENGLIQPIIVRPSPISGYDLIAGERRFRASQMAGLTEILALVKDISDDDSMTQAIIENLQRADLNPIEEALAYQQLIEKQGLTHDEVAKIMGKSRPYISNSIRLLNLSPLLQDALSHRTISPGHARLLVALSTAKQEQWLATIIDKELTVRQLEKQLKGTQYNKKQSPDRFVKDQEARLKRMLGLETSISLSPSGHGKLTISFSSLDDFHNLINNLENSVDKCQ